MCLRSNVPAYRRVETEDDASGHEQLLVSTRDDGYRSSEELNTTMFPGQTSTAAQLSRARHRSDKEAGLGTAVLLQQESDAGSALKAAGTLDPETRDDNEARRKLYSFKSKFSGWKVSATFGACASTVALAVNIGILMWLRQQPHHYYADYEGQVPVYSGSCQTVKIMSILVHLAINILSTILLGASNLSMQVLSAPRRSEVDRAHAKGKYLDIGVQSVRNLTKISPWRTLLWFLLSLSSVPLHLLYNSAFYSSISTQDYWVFSMTADWRSYTASDGIPENDYYDTGDLSGAAIYLAYLTRHPESLEYLEPADCLKNYAKTIISDRSNLILITNDRQKGSHQSPLLDHVFYDWDAAVTRGGPNYHPYPWICAGSSNMSEYLNIGGDAVGCNAKIGKLESNFEHWTPWDHNIDHCLSQRVDPEVCGFIGDMEILKLIVAYGLGSNPPLITVGDAISSFLQQPDATTTGCGILSRADVDSLYATHRTTDGILSALRARAVVGTPASRQKLPWSKAASHTRWTVTLGFIVIAILVVGVFFGIGYTVVSGYAGESIETIGFGTPEPATIVTDWLISSTTGTALVANAPQFIFSFLYVNLNSLVTCMWLASEWNDFASERKPLRVSLPRAEQRSTYFLSLPWRVGIPLVIVSLLMHWLISESLFLANVAETGWDGGRNLTTITSLGFSLGPMIVVMISGILLCVGTAVLGRMRKLKGEGFMPLVGSCSLAIAAACHAPAGDEGAHLTGVMWGAVADEKHVSGT